MKRQCKTHENSLPQCPRFLAIAYSFLLESEDYADLKYEYLKAAIFGDNLTELVNLKCFKKDTKIVKIL